MEGNIYSGWRIIKPQHIVRMGGGITTALQPGMGESHEITCEIKPISTILLLNLKCLAKFSTASMGRVAKLFIVFDREDHETMREHNAPFLFVIKTCV